MAKDIKFPRGFAAAQSGLKDAPPCSACHVPIGPQTTYVKLPDVDSAQNDSRLVYRLYCAACAVSARRYAEMIAEREYGVADEHGKEAARWAYAAIRLGESFKAEG